jgi:hypothetical protein
MNIPKLQIIKQQILAEPDSFRMDTWSCGTAHCIGGRAVLNDGMKIVNPDDYAFNMMVEDGRSVYSAASIALDLTEDQADRLFDVENWPDDLARRYDDDYDIAPTRAMRAAIAAERIDRFIATDGAE